MSHIALQKQSNCDIVVVKTQTQSWLACEGRHGVNNSAELCHAACSLQCVTCHAECHAVCSLQCVTQREVITKPPDFADTLYLDCQNNEELSRHKMQHFS